MRRRIHSDMTKVYIEEVKIALLSLPLHTTCYIDTLYPQANVIVY